MKTRSSRKPPTGRSGPVPKFDAETRRLRKTELSYRYRRFDIDFRTWVAENHPDIYAIGREHVEAALAAERGLLPGELPIHKEPK